MNKLLCGLILTYTFSTPPQQGPLIVYPVWRSRMMVQNGVQRYQVTGCQGCAWYTVATFDVDPNEPWRVYP